MSIASRRFLRKSTPTGVGGATLTLSVSKLSNDSVRVTWTSSLNPTAGWTVGRDGTDATGYGPWQTTVAGTTREQSFTQLVATDTYTFTVSGGDLTTSVTYEMSPGTGTIVGFATGTITETSIALSWAYSGSTLTNYTLRRGSTVIATLPAASTSYNDTGLTKGTDYTYTLTGNIAAGGTTNTVSASGRTTGGSSYPANVIWLSGASAASAQYNGVRDFGIWRGQTTRFATSWVDGADHNMGGGGPTMYASGGYTGVLCVSKHAPTGFTWTGAAAGNYDGFFNAYADGIVQLANNSQIREIHSNFGFEFNGSWFECSIVKGQSGQRAMLPYLKSGWKRYVDILRAKRANARIPIKICVNYTWDTHGDANVTEIMNAIDPNTVDLIGLDYYDAYKPTPSTHLSNLTEWNQEFMRTKDGGATPVGLGAWRQFIQATGKPITFPEWGLSDYRAQGDYDNPFYIQKMNEFFRSILPADPGNPDAGQLGGDAYYNNESLGKIYPDPTTLPNSRNMYRSLKWGEN